MKVQLIAITQPASTVLDGHVTTAEQLIVYTARVSNPQNQTNMETGPRLLRYCIRNGHWSVFETASMTVEITTSRAIAAQILRHRSFTFQEFSQRYAMATGYEQMEFRLQDKKNRQASGRKLNCLDLDWMAIDAVQTAFDAYNALIDKGVSRETARMVLPLCTQTTLYMTGNVRSWIHYLEQRTSEGTQKEHRQVAEAIKAIFDQQFPVIAAALKEVDQ